jgi:hypothetical protein
MPLKLALRGRIIILISVNWLMNISTHDVMCTKDQQPFLVWIWLWRFNMRLIFAGCYLFLLLLPGCSFKNENITKLKRPDNKILQAFNFNEKYDVVYQFYQEYKTTEKVSHMIAIVKMHDNGFKLKNSLPISRSSLKQLTKIEKSKFLDGRPIIFNPERILNEDIRTKAVEYGSGKDYNVFHSDGYYQIISNGRMEAIVICDTENDLMYIEAVK